MASLSDLYVIAAPLDHPEGIATGPDGELYAGGEAGQVYRIDRAAGTPSEIANTGGFVLGLCHDAAGMIYLCNLDSTPAILRVNPATGAIDTWCDSAGGGPLETPNWPAFAPDGWLYFTDSGTEDMDIQNGRLIRVPPGGGDGEVLDLGPLHFPNGMCVDPAGTPVFLETLTPRLSRVVDGRVELIADLPGTSPDGVAVCADGGYIVAVYYPFRLLYVPPEGGRVDLVLDDPSGIHIPMPTNVTFYDEGLAKLAIGSLGGMVVKGIDLGIAGAPLNYPAQPFETRARLRPSLQDVEAAKRLGRARALGHGRSEVTLAEGLRRRPLERFGGMCPRHDDDSVGIRDDRVAGRHGDARDAHLDARARRPRDVRGYRAEMSLAQTPGIRAPPSGRCRGRGRR